jgi:ketosteroid isomerase-like protein
VTSTVFVLASAILIGAPQQGKTADAAEVLALEQKIEAAVVRGDVAFVSSVLSDDFHFVHGDGWTTGGKALMEDDKAAFLKRVADKEYAVHDLDGVRVEMHGDVAITYGRYVSLFVPKNRGATPGQLNSIWFERVYAKRDGRWMFLSHRTVHGPTPSPAGVDPGAAR